jgi:hypothetical protein
MIGVSGKNLSEVMVKISNAIISGDTLNQRTLDTIGMALALVGTIVSMAGVIYNNCLLWHIVAMQVWVISNAIFAGYFYGRIKCWWDGGLPDILLCLNYVVMLVTGIYGLMQ